MSSVATPQGATVTDRVCGMQVDLHSAAGSAPYEGRQYYFCSTACRARPRDRARMAPRHRTRD